MRASELLLYIFLVVGVILFNLLMRLLSRRSRQQGPDDQPVPAEATPRRLPDRAATAPEEVWGRLPEAVQRPPESPARRAAAAPDGRPVPPRRHSSALLGSRQNMRHAVVLMTVLGPCRALAPYDERRSDRPL